MNGLSAIDNALLQGASKHLSAEELGKFTNLPPAEALLRTKKLLSSRDVWSEYEKRLLILHDLQNLKSLIEQKLREEITTSDVNTMLRIIKEIGVALGTIEKLNDKELARITQLHANTMLSLINTALGDIKTLIQEKYPKVDFIEITDAFNLSLEKKASNLLSNEVD